MSGSPSGSRGGGRPGPATPSETLEGEVMNLTYENVETGFRVARVRTPKGDLPIVGVFVPAPPGTRVRATGHYEESTRHGRQFRVQSLIPIVPETLEGLVKFLSSGIIKGIGPAYAKRLVDAFGTDTMRVLEHEPDRLAQVSGLGKRRAQALVEGWASHRSISDIMVFLQAHGASPSLAHRVFKRFGPRAVEIVKRSPYRLALDVWGIGFSTADRIARSVGFDPRAPERLQAGLLQVLIDVSQRGHVLCPRDSLLRVAGEMLAIDEAELAEALDALVKTDYAHEESVGDGERAVYLRDLFVAECRLARRLATLLAAPPKKKAIAADDALAACSAFETRASVQLADAQRDAIVRSIAHPVFVVTGGPGVGKTTIVRALLDLFQQKGQFVRLAAPTGRAAKRMSEATGHEASTLHRLMEFDPRLRTFARNDDNPLEDDVFIIDEASMIDLALADALTQAIPRGGRLILVGDMDQLPSVGPGAVLRDVLSADRIPMVHLTEIFRQAGGSSIVVAAHDIRVGEPPKGDEQPTGQFFVIMRPNAEAAAETTLQLVTQRIPERFGLDPITDVQVLTPMHQGPAGAIALNQRLQSALNHTSASVTRGQKTLKLGDKVMQLRNDYDRDVFNGDVGVVSTIDAEARKLSVRFEEREVQVEESDLDELTLAYAMTIHKSQGSEYPAVVIPMLSSHFVMLSRNLLYTAVTRGKRLVVLVTDERALRLALSETRKEERATYLGPRLRAAVDAMPPA